MLNPITNQVIIPILNQYSINHPAALVYVLIFCFMLLCHSRFENYESIHKWDKFIVCKYIVINYMNSCAFGTVWNRLAFHSFGKVSLLKPRFQSVFMPPIKVFSVYLLLTKHQLFKVCSTYYTKTCRAGINLCKHLFVNIDF